MYIMTNRNLAKGSFGGKEAPDHKVSYVNMAGAGAEPEQQTSQSLQIMSPQNFRRQVIDDLRILGESHERSLLIVPIHGFNNGWSDSVRFIRKIDQELTLQIPGALTVGYSWPSGGKVSAYLGDRMRARWSAIPFTQVLADVVTMLQRERCPAEVVVIAHSMGNYLLALATSWVSEHFGDPDFAVFSEAIMVAPDLDGNCFEPGKVCEHLAKFSRRITVYRSRKDAAILGSRAKRGGLTGRRLGRQGPGKWLPDNVVMVDATSRAGRFPSVKTHSLYFSDPQILADLRQVVNGTDRAEISTRALKDGEFVIADDL